LRADRLNDGGAEALHDFYRGDVAGLRYLFRFGLAGAGFGSATCSVSGAGFLSLLFRSHSIAPVAKRRSSSVASRLSSRYCAASRKRAAAWGRVQMISARRPVHWTCAMPKPSGPIADAAGINEAPE